MQLCILWKEIVDHFQILSELFKVFLKSRDDCPPDKIDSCHNIFKLQTLDYFFYRGLITLAFVFEVSFL